MKQLKEKILANEKMASGFYRMRIASKYLSRVTKPGQFFEVRVCDKAELLLRRPFSCHRILKGAVEILYEVVGPATEALSKRKKGEQIDIIGPLGNGFNLEKGPAVLIAGGIGIAPLLALAEKLKGKATVLLGARTRSQVLCEKELKALGCEVRIATDDGSKGHKGFVTDLLRDFLRKYPQYTIHNTLYACGPHAMLKEVAKLAKAHNTPCQVSLEERMACGVGVCLGCPVEVHNPQYSIHNTRQYKMVCKDGPVFDAYDIIWQADKEGV